MNSNLRLKRINELTEISKKRELTEAEKIEREQLRKEYLDEFRNRFRQQIENIVIETPDGTKKTLQKKGSMLH